MIENKSKKIYDIGLAVLLSNFGSIERVTGLWDWNPTLKTSDVITRWLQSGTYVEDNAISKTTYTHTEYMTQLVLTI